MARRGARQLADQQAGAGSGRGVFYGWHIVGAASFMVFVSAGFRQGYGLFVPAWRDDFGASVTMFSVIASAGWVVNGLAQPVAGALADTHGARKVTALSLAVLGCSIAGMALAPNVWTLAFFYATLASFAIAGAQFTPVTPLIARWFVRRRGAALSVLTAGGSAGAMLLIPLAANIEALWNWRAAIGVIAGMTLLLALPLVLLVLRDSPGEMGLSPDGDAPGGDGGARREPMPQGPLTVDRWRNAYRSAPMWQLTLTYVVCGVTTAIISVHFVTFAKTEGVPETTAAYAFGLLSFMNMAGVLAMGVVSDRLLRKNALAVIYAVRGVGFLALLVLPVSSGLWVFAVVAGSSWLATVPQTSALAAEIYGIRNSGAITGMLTMVHMLAGAVAVLAAGLAYDWLGSYDGVWLTSAGTLAAASLLAWVLREREYSARFNPVRLAEA